MFKNAKCYKCNIPSIQFKKKKSKIKKPPKIKTPVIRLPGAKSKTNLILAECEIKEWKKTK